MLSLRSLVNSCGYMSLADPYGIAASQESMALDIALADLTRLLSLSSND